MLSAYPACFIKEESGYSVIFPDLNYLATSGETIDEAFAMAVDCLAGYLFESQKDGTEIPDASQLKTISVSDIAKELELKDCDESFVNIVTVDVEEYAKSHFNKAVKKTLTIPEWLNNSAIEAKLNFSQVLQEALIQRLGNIKVK
ncbi:MAG: type II toxin-antitoxin system HicB family antitoxin [Anaerostipes sp.]|jgi:predicted RNase H-like HicB family nuclease|nr:type II toxin-antitoxin system HicB family antitoxin [Anaerostipes sp.]